MYFNIKEDISMSMRVVKILVAAITAGAMSVAYAQQAPQQGQQSAPPTGGGQGAQQQIDVSDEDVKNFAAAQSEVQSVREDYSGKLRDVEDTEKAREVQAEMQEEMLQAVKDAGLSARKYNEISQAAMQDNELRQRIEDAME